MPGPSGDVPAASKTPTHSLLLSQENPGTRRTLTNFLRIGVVQFSGSPIVDTKAAGQEK